MLTEQLFELWGVDNDVLYDVCRHHGVGSAVILGGSLADNIGTPNSDIDLYHFTQTGTAPTHSFVALGQRVLHLHAVDLVDLPQLGAALWNLLDGIDSLEGFPRLSPIALSDLHALNAGRTIHDDGSLEQLRAESGADLLGTYLLGRGLARVREILVSGRPLQSADLHALLEAAADTYVAATGATNPNPKWRVELIRRIAAGRPESTYLIQLMQALRSDTEMNAGERLDVASACLHEVFEEPAVQLLFSDVACAEIAGALDELRAVTTA